MELFVVPKSYYRIKEERVLVHRFLPNFPSPHLCPLLELICTKWEFCYLFNWCKLLFQIIPLQGLGLFVFRVSNHYICFGFKILKIGNLFNVVHQ